MEIIHEFRQNVAITGFGFDPIIELDALVVLVLQLDPGNLLRPVWFNGALLGQFSTPLVNNGLAELVYETVTRVS